MNTGEITNPPSGNMAPDTVVPSQGGTDVTPGAWDIMKGAKSLVNWWIRGIRSRNKGDQSNNDTGSVSEVLTASPGTRAVDVDPSSRAVQEYGPQIKALADEMQTIGVGPYESALVHANSLEGVAGVVAPEMERLERTLGTTDATRERLEQQTRPVTDAIDRLVKLDELEAIVGGQEGRGAHAITDQYKARVSALIRATINDHQANVIRDTLEADAPYPPTSPQSQQEIALAAIGFVESVWKVLREENKTELEFQVDEQAQSTDAGSNVETAQDGQAGGTQSAATIEADTGTTAGERRNTQHTREQTRATEIEALIKALPIGSAEQNNVRTELTFILAQYSQALHTDPVRALMSSTSVMPVVQERIDQSRSDIANIPAVVQAGRELASLFSQLDELLKADLLVRARIAGHATQRIQALIDREKGAQIDASILQNFQTIQSLLQEYAGPNLTRERAKAIIEEMRRFVEALAVDPGDEHYSVLTAGLGQHIEDNNDELKPGTGNERKRKSPRKQRGPSKGSSSVGAPTPATDGGSKDEAGNEALQVSSDTGERTAGLADFRVLRSAVLASESNIEGIRKLGFYTRDPGDATETVRMILEDEHRTQREQLELVREYIRSMYDRPSADAAIGAISSRGFEALCCDIAITTQYESTALSAALRLDTPIFIRVFFQHNGNPNAKSALLMSYLEKEKINTIMMLLKENLLSDEDMRIVEHSHLDLVDQLDTTDNTEHVIPELGEMPVGLESLDPPHHLPDGYRVRRIVNSRGWEESVEDNGNTIVWKITKINTVMLEVNGHSQSYAPELNFQSENDGEPHEYILRMHGYAVRMRYRWSGQVGDDGNRDNVRLLISAELCREQEKREDTTSGAQDSMTQHTAADGDQTDAESQVEEEAGEDVASQEPFAESQSTPEGLPIPAGYERIAPPQYYSVIFPITPSRKLEINEVLDTIDGKRVRVKYGLHEIDGNEQRGRLWIFDPALAGENASGGELTGDDAHTFVHGEYAVVGRVVENGGLKIAQIELFRKSEEPAQWDAADDEEGESAGGSPEPGTGGEGVAQEAPATAEISQEEEVSATTPDEKVAEYAAPEIGTRPTDLEPFTPSFIICNDENTGFSQRDPPNEFTSGGLKIRVRNGTSQSNTGHVCVDILSNEEKYDVLAQQLISWTEGSTDLTDIRVEQAKSPLVLWGKARIIPGEEPRVVYILELCTRYELTAPQVISQPGVSANAVPEAAQKRPGEQQFTSLAPSQIMETFASAFDRSATPESIVIAKNQFASQLLAVGENLDKNSIESMFKVLRSYKPIVLRELVTIFRENSKISEWMHANSAVQARIVQGMLENIYLLKMGGIKDHVQLYEQVLSLAPTDVSAIPADLRSLYVFDSITSLDSISDSSVPVARSLVLRIYGSIHIPLRKKELGISIFRNLESTGNMNRWNRFIPLSDDAQAETFLQLINDNSIVLGGDIRSKVNLILPERGYIANEAGVWRRAET